MSSVIFFGGKIITMNGDEPEAIFVEDGIIKQTGERNSIFMLAGNDTIHINLHKHCLMPSFIDGHSHITKYAMSLGYVDLSECKTIDEITEKLKQYKELNKISNGQWIIGTGYDNNNLIEKRQPNKLDFDVNFKNNPILISHISGHMGVINQNALDKLNINKETPDIKGGVIERDENNNPTGYMEENAFFKISGKLPQLTLDEKIILFKKAQNIYLQNGVTTVQDGMLNDEDFDLLKTLATNDILLCDIVGYADIKNSAHLLKENPVNFKKYSNHLKLQGYKIFLDGSPQGRTAWVNEPYNKVSPNDDENYCGYPEHSDEEVADFFKKAMEDNVQLLAHCNGDAAIKQFVLNAPKAYKNNRPVAIHAQLMPIKLLETVKEKGIIPSYFVAHTYYWGDAHIKNLGIKRAEKISPLKSTEKLGIPFTLHQDCPVLPPDMIKTLWCAVNRKTKNGVLLGENEKISVFEALKSVTINGAYEYFEEESKGTIEVGKRADLIVLSENPLECESENLDKISVLATFKDGSCVFKKADFRI